MFDGSKTKTDEDKDLVNAFCATPLEGRSLRGKIKFEVGTAEQCLEIGPLFNVEQSTALLIEKDITRKVVTYIVGYVDDLIVVDRSNQHNVS